MSNYPDDFRFRHFDATFGTGPTEREERFAPLENLYEQQAERLNAMCSYAWQKYPVNGAAERWSIVTGALLNADNVLKAVSLSNGAKAAMKHELAIAQDANANNDVAGFKQCIGLYMFQYGQAIEEMKRDGGDYAN